MDKGDGLASLSSTMHLSGRPRLLLALAFGVACVGVWGEGSWAQDAGVVFDGGPAEARPTATDDADAGPPADAGGDDAAPAPTAPLVMQVQVLGAKSALAEQSTRELFGVVEQSPFSPRDVRAGIKRLFAAGAWANIEVFSQNVPGGVALQVVLTPDLVVGDVEFDVNRPLPIERLRKALDVQSGDRLRPRTVERVEAQMKEALADLGYPKARVVVSTTGDSYEERDLRVRILTNLPTLVRTLDLQGELGLRRSDLQDELALWQGVPFDRVRTEQGLARVKQVLLRRRYLGAKAEVVSLAFTDDKSAVDIVVRVEPGARYRVRMQGNDVISDAYLKAVVNETHVKGLSPSDLDAAKRKLVEFYQKNGFALVKASVSDIAGDDDERVLLFNIEEGPHARVEEVVVEGADKLDGEELAADALSFVRAEGAAAGLFHRLDEGDLDDLLGTTDRKPDEPRAVEKSDWDLHVDWDTKDVSRSLSYRAPLFALVRDRLEDTYNAKGFLQARVEGPETIWLDGGKQVRVRYRVHEGPQTIVGTVRLDPSPPPIPFDEIIAASRIAPGEPANLYAIEQTRLQIAQLLRKRGFPDVNVTESLVQVDEGKADIVIHIDAGDQVTLGDILVRGNDKTFEFLVRYHLDLESGVLYNEEDIERARQRMQQSGLFGGVQVGFVEGADGPVRDLEVRVRERKPWAAEIGGGMSLNDGPRVFGSLAWRNIWGSGVGLRIRGKVNNPWPFFGLVYTEGATSPRRFFDDSLRNRITQQLQLQPSATLTEAILLGAEGAFFTEGQVVGGLDLPKAFFVPWPTRFHSDIVGTREIRQAFTLERGSWITGVDSRPIPWWRVGAQVEAELSNFNCPRDDGVTTQGCGQGNQAITRRQDAGFVRQMTYRAFSSIDFRDDPITPRQGVFASGTAEVALGSGTLRNALNEAQEVAVDFVKVHGVVRGYVPIGPLLTLGLSLRGGNIFPLGDDIYVPLFKRFYLGGTSTIRGFNEDEVLPVDDARYHGTWNAPASGTDDTLISFGGRFFVNSRSEVRINIGGGFELSAFVDAGQLFEDVLNYQPMPALGTGAGVRYATPVGPLALHIGVRALDGRRAVPRVTDLTSAYNVHLSFGYF